MAIRLSKPLAFAIEFSNFSIAYGIPPRDLAEMVAHAERAVKAYERATSADTAEKGEKDNEYHNSKVKEIAEKYHCTVTYSGLWPHVGNNHTSARLLPSQ